MAGTLNDEIKRATAGPTVNDGQNAFFLAGGGPVGGTLNDREKAAKIAQYAAPATATLNDAWMAAPFPGTINDKQYAAWKAV